MIWDKSISKGPNQAIGLIRRALESIKQQDRVHICGNPIVKSISVEME